MSEAQTTTMLKMLRKAGNKGVENYKFPEARILRYSQTVKTLREQGYNIQLERVHLPNGRATGVWKYYLVEEVPKGIKRFFKK